MKNAQRLLVFVGLVLMIFVGPATAEQGEAIAYPERWYEKSERGPNDWVVEFSLPKDAQVRHVFCAGNAKEDGLFDKSDVSYGESGGRKLVIVTAGWLARRQTGYKGDLSSWARTLRVRYAAAFQPRGPGCRPIRPRG